MILTKLEQLGIKKINAKDAITASASGGGVLIRIVYTPEAEAHLRSECDCPESLLRGEEIRFSGVIRLGNAWWVQLVRPW